MERGVRSKQVEKEFTAQLSIDGHPWIQEILGAQITTQIHHDQGTTARFGQAACRIRELGNGAGGRSELALRIPQQNGKPSGAEQLHQPAQFPLPKDGQRKRAGKNQGIDQRRCERKIEKPFNEPSESNKKQVPP